MLVNASHIEETMIPGANHFIPWTKFDEIKSILLKLDEDDSWQMTVAKAIC